MPIFRRRRQPEGEPEHEDEQRALLEAKPFVPQNLIQRVFGAHEVIRDEIVNLDQIVSCSTSGDPTWYQAGQTKPITEGRQVRYVDSYEYAGELALNRVYAMPIDNRISLRPFKDETGAEWYMVNDGKHRVMAAIMNNESYLTVDIERPYEGESYFPGDVRADYIDK